MNEAWDLLFGELLAAREELTHRDCQTLLKQLPAYRTVPREVLDAEVWFQIEQVLQAARRRPAQLVDSREFAGLEGIGEARAQQGVPVSDMLSAWRIGIRTVVGHGREVGTRLGVDGELLLDFVQSALAWSDAAMIATAGAHHRAELSIALADETRRTEFVRGALLGTVPTAQLRVQAEAYGLDPGADYIAVRARDDPAHTLQRVFDADQCGPRRGGLTAVVDGDLAGLVSRRPPETIDGVVGFGPPRPLESLAESYRLAVRALMTAQVCGLKGAYDISALGVRAAVATDTDVGAWLQQRYLEPLQAGGSARELIETLRAYLASGMHVGRTAELLFIHQNTVRYRLGRFEKLTDTSLLDAEVLVELWWLLELSTMRL